MNRRKFIEHSLFFSSAVVFAPSLLQSCRKQNLFKNISFNGKVGIIGAGAAGLYAAYILKENGIDFEILEASDRIGGRLGKKQDFCGFDLDLGAEWLHGKNSIAGDLVKKSETLIFEDDVTPKYWFNQQIVDALPAPYDKLLNENLIFGGDKEDISLEAYCRQLNIDDKGNSVMEALAGEYGASAEHLSLKLSTDSMNDWSSGSKDYKFKKTYYDLVYSQIGKIVEDKVRLNFPVYSVDYSGDLIRCISDSEALEFDKVILTVPLPILQNNLIQFIPALSAEKRLAIDSLGMEAGLKIFLKFSEKFFNDGLIGGELCPVWDYEAYGKDVEEPVMLGFVMGKMAENIRSYGNNAIQACLDELDVIYDGKASATFIDGFIQDWKAEPWIGGAYSYDKVGSSNARNILSESVEDKLFFAGEATNTGGHPQTVHGAMETGFREVAKILKSV